MVEKSMGENGGEEKGREKTQGKMKNNVSEEEEESPVGVEEPQESPGSLTLVAQTGRATLVSGFPAPLLRAGGRDPAPPLRAGG